MPANTRDQLVAEVREAILAAVMEPDTFILSIDPEPPHKAVLHCPGGVTVLLSRRQAVAMMAAEAARRSQVD